ncbi:MAG TPA: L-seryl-tRNA(Sec) selenium transferase [Firmicutes bacterium]|nr:L-seryl-tRNA(Sec) selenium transferase [Bacillota bacterium]
MDKQDLLRSIPAVERVLEQADLETLARRLPRWAVTEGVRLVLDRIRQSIVDGERQSRPEMAEILEEVRLVAEHLAQRGIGKVINATGVLLHTNLGRAILSESAVEAVTEVARGYSSLEIDLDSGKRTSRLRHIEGLLKRIVGCEAATAVNNNAGAVLLALNTLADGKEVIVSRGELIEIGGSFRLPEVIAKSGTIMVEVGTTNRTHLDDYRRAISDRTAAILKVHRSNFEMTGFVESVASAELAELAHKHDLILIEDLGSGALVDYAEFGIEHEPMPQESLRHGADIVTFSGDKLLCGPQAGIVVGRKHLVDEMKVNPLARALRLDKMTLAALEATLRIYLEPEKIKESIPVLKMISTPVADLEARARTIEAMLKEKVGGELEITVERESSQIGGGSLPGVSLETAVVKISSRHKRPDEISSVLRKCKPPIIARIANDKVILDLRTVQPSEDDMLVTQIAAAFAGGGTH